MATFLASHDTCSCSQERAFVVRAETTTCSEANGCVYEPGCSGSWCNEGAVEDARIIAISPAASDTWTTLSTPVHYSVVDDGELCSSHSGSCSGLCSTEDNTYEAKPDA